MDTTELCAQWPYLLTLLPPDLDASARRCGALVRCREVPDAQTLLRLLLAYAATDLSLKDVAAWAVAAKIAQVSGPALFYRVRHADAWLSELLASVLEQEVAAPQGLRLPVRVVDASVLTGPGALGTDWRVHVMGHPQTGGFSAVDLTDASGGESFSRYTVARGDVVLGDRGYGRAAGIAALHEQGAFVVSRLIPQAIRLCTPERAILRCAQYEPQVEVTGVSSWDVLLPVPPERASASHGAWRLCQARDWIPGRLLAARPRQQDVVWVFTTLATDQATGAQVMDLYRVRWQVELLFKRLKSLLHLDSLPSRSGPTARSWILSRLLLAALGQRLLAPTFSPWGYRLRDQRHL
jgi:hypothetical protein